MTKKTTIGRQVRYEGLYSMVYVMMGCGFYDDRPTNWHIR